MGVLEEEQEEVREWVQEREEEENDEGVKCQESQLR